MKKIFTLFLLSSSIYSFSQVGINTNAPKATLDVVGNPTDTSSKDGVIAPRLTGDQLRAKSDVYGTDQTGAIVYATAADSSPAGKTINVTSSGYYYFDGSVWVGLKGDDGEDSGLKKSPENNITAYLAKAYTSGSSSTTPYKIPNMGVIGTAGDNFNPTTGAFTVANSGVYEFTASIELSASVNSPSNFVIGLIDDSTNKWIARGSFTRTTNERTFTIQRAVSLTAGQVVYFGINSNTNIIVSSSGSTGKGLGTYFKIQYLNSGSIDEDGE